MSDDLKGTVFNGRYTILERVGAGGMATVYRARDEETSSFVAIKILSREFLDRNPKEAERNLRRFKREAEILQILAGNPRVVDFVQHACSENGDWFIAMELLEGEQLSYFIRRGEDVLPVHTLLHYGVHLVEGLKSIHEKQILHRDLAPDNIVLVKDADGIRVPKFLDFGIGKSIGGELDQVTEMLTIMGKPQYFSPEQARGFDLTPASDVYSLGVVLYQMVTGHVPLEIRGIPDFKKIQKEPPSPIGSFREGMRIPPELQAVIMRCLAKTPEDRPLLDEVLEVLNAVRERANAGEVFHDASATLDSDYTTPVPLRTESETGLADGYFFFPKDTPGAELAEGDTINRYVIKRLVGRGGMGSVYEAWDPDLRRKVALKVATQIEEEKAKRRVLNEARASAALRCENIVTIYDVGTDGGTPFISMEFVEGSTLAQVIEEEGALSGQRFWEIARGLCDGLSLAHDRDEPVIHRDLKPANVLVHRHVAKITDFGIAKVTKRSKGSQGPDTGAHDVGGGTAATMSPEQINDQSVDNRSDLYSLGCVLYMMATGRGPFQGNQIAIVYQHCNAEPTPPSKIATEASPDLDRIILKLLAKEPDDRYQSAAEVLDDLRVVFAPDEIPARPWYRSPIALVAAVALVVATIAVIQILTPEPPTIARIPFGIRFVRADNFEPGSTYYVRENAVGITVVGQEGAVFDTEVRVEGELEVPGPEATMGSEPLIHEIALGSNKTDAATTYAVTLLVREEAAEPLSFTVVHDPTPPRRTVITHGGHTEPLGQTIRAMHGSPIVFEVVDEESGFSDGEGGRIMRWRSDEGDRLESVRVTQDPGDPDSRTLEVTDLTGRQFNSEVTIIRVAPRLRTPLGLIRTNRADLLLPLDLECPPFDLAATPLSDGDVEASIGGTATPVKRDGSRYVVALKLPDIGDAATQTHSVAFTFRGQPMADSVKVVHDPVAPTMRLTYSPVGEETQPFKIDEPPSEPLRKRSSESMASLFQIAAMDADGLQQNATVSYAGQTRQVRIGGGGAIRLPEDIPEQKAFDVAVKVSDLAGNESLLSWRVDVIGASVNHITVAGRQRAEGAFFVPEERGLAVRLSATGVTANDRLIAVLEDAAGEEVGREALQQASDGEFNATLAFPSPEARSGNLVIKTEDNRVITRYGVFVDRIKPRLTTTLYEQPSAIDGTLTVGRFPPIVIRVQDAGRIDEQDTDISIETLEGDLELRASSAAVEGGIELKVAAPQGKEMVPGKWRIRYQTQDFAGSKSNALSVLVHVQPPSLYVKKAGELVAPLEIPRQFDTRVVPIKGNSIDLVVENRAGLGHFLLGFKTEGTAEIQTTDIAVAEANPTSVRIPGLEGQSGSVDLHWYQVVGDDSTVAPPIWFDTLRWKRDAERPTWHVIRNGLQVTDNPSLLAINGLQVSRLSNIKLRVEDDCGFSSDEAAVISNIGGDPLVADFSPRGKHVTWAFRDVPNWTSRVIKFDVKDLSGRTTPIELLLIREANAPQLNRVTAEDGCTERNDTWVARSRVVTLDLSNRAPRVVGIKVGVTADGYSETIPVKDISKSFKVELKLPKDGEYVVKLTAERDDTGMADTPFAETRVRIDTVPPAIAIRHEDRVVTEDAMEVERFDGFSAHVNDAYGIERVAFKLSGGAPSFTPLSSSGQNVYGIPNQERGPGTYRLSVIARDIAGHETTHQVDVTMKPKRPVVPPTTVLSVAQIQALAGMRAVPVVHEGKTRFYMAETEATVGHFRAFRGRVSADLAARIQAFKSQLSEIDGVSAAAATRIDRARIDAVWKRNQQAEDDMPLRYVYYDVAAFFAFECGGGRLPTADEWKNAAGLFTKPDAKWLVFVASSGPKSATRYFRHPSSREWCNFADPSGGPRAAGAMSPQSPFGLRGLAGNVAEWIAENATMGGSYQHQGNNSTTGGGLIGRKPHAEARDLESLRDIGVRILWPEPEGGR